jgi:hypothetical protein
MKHISIGKCRRSCVGWFTYVDFYTYVYEKRDYENEEKKIMHATMWLCGGVHISCSIETQKHECVETFWTIKR